jgi:hypothetical protein
MYPKHMLWLILRCGVYASTIAGAAVESREKWALAPFPSDAPPMRGGLYPCLSLTQRRAVTRSIQIDMGFDRNGERFDEFFPEIP